MWKQSLYQNNFEYCVIELLYLSNIQLYSFFQISTLTTFIIHFLIIIRLTDENSFTTSRLNHIIRWLKCSSKHNSVDFCQTSLEWKFNIGGVKGISLNELMTLINATNWALTFLTSSILNLYLDSLIINLDATNDELNTNGTFGLSWTRCKWNDQKGLSFLHLNRQSKQLWKDSHILRLCSWFIQIAIKSFNGQNMEEKVI